VVALAALVIVALVIRSTVFTEEAVPVVVALAATGSVEETVTNTRAGTVEAKRRAKLSPEVGGMVLEMPFREGDRVPKGAVVLRLDDSLPLAELNLAERELQAATAQREEACFAAGLAERERERIQKLADEAIASADLADRADTEFRRAGAACDAGAASVARAEAAVKLAQTRVDKMVLKAPFEGVVAEADAELGEWVTPSPPALPVPPAIDLLDPDSIHVSAPMDEVDSARIDVGQRVRVTVDSFPDRAFAGQVARIAPYVLDIEAQNRTVEVEVTFDDPVMAQKMLPGTSADVEVILEVRENVLRVPTAAILEGSRVLVVSDENRLEERSIDLGLRNWDFTEVRDGLTAGERVVVSLDRVGVAAGAAVVVEAEEGAP
jgi:HlyD family secretion protein